MADETAVAVPEEGNTEAGGGLVVTAPLVRVEDKGGRLVYLYRGAKLDGIADDEIARLVDLDMVGDGFDVLPGVAAHPEAKKK